MKTTVRRSLLAVSMIAILAAVVARGIASDSQSPLPMPLGAPPGATHKLPDNLPGATGGPYLNPETVDAITLDVIKARDGVDFQIRDKILTTHGALIRERVFGQSYSVGESREVYLVTATGTFTFKRVLEGVEPIRVSFINIEIDATNGDVLAVGTSEATLNPTVLDALRNQQGL